MRYFYEKTKYFIRLLNTDITVTIKSFIQNVLISAFIFLPLFLGFAIFGTNSALILFIIYVMLFIILFHIFGRWFSLIAIPTLIFSAFITPYMYLTKTKLSYNVISSIYETDLHESMELLSSPFFIKYIAIFLIILFLPFSIKYINPISKALSIKIKPTILLIPLLLLFGFISIKESERGVVSYKSNIWNYFPLRQIVFIKKSFYENIFLINQYKNININYNVKANKNNDISVILVIGEASRKSSLGIYGNDFNTTPYMSYLKLNQPKKIIYFSNMLTVAPFTRVAVPSLFSMSNALNNDSVTKTPSLFRIINQTKVKTKFITIREQNTFHDSLPNEIIKDNKAVFNLNKKYDGDLLPIVRKEIEKNEKSLICIHLKGSHYRYKDRYPSKHSCFKPDIPKSNYLNSIRYTDFVLSKIMSYIQKSKTPYVVLYVPDHGEYVGDYGDTIYGHGFRKLTRYEVEIPFVFMFNAKFINEKQKIMNILENNKKKKVSLDNISHTILGLLGINDEFYYDKSYNLISNSFTEHERYIIDRDMNIKNIKNIKFYNKESISIKVNDICKN